MDYICLNDCDNRLINCYSTDKVYKYKQGKIYQYIIVSAYVRNTIYSGGIYCGWVNNDFVTRNFMLKDEYDKILKEVDSLFEGFLIHNICE